MIVIDASVLATALLDEEQAGDSGRARIWLEELAAPELIDIEVAAVWRKKTFNGEMSSRRAEFALEDLAAIPLLRARHEPLLPRCWELRDNLTIYDASYVSLAEALECTLLTADARLAKAPGLRCQVEVLE